METTATTAADTTTTAGATTTAATTASTETVTATAPDWTTGLNDDAKGYVQNKGFKGPTDLLDAYRNFEKLMGVPKERLLKLPEKDDDPAWGEIQTRLGKPESPDKYSFKVDKDTGDEAFEKWAKGTFHEAGFTDKQASKFMEKWAGYAKEQVSTQTQEFQAKLQQEESAIKKEWGSAFDQNVSLAKRAATELGIKPEQIDALEKTMGFAGVMKLFHGLGTKVGEAQFTTGNTSGGKFGAMTPAQAQNRIQSLRADPGFVSKYVQGDASAREEMAILHKQAYPDS